ncbi:STAS domain-containing protein [Rubrivirga sp. IMCC45206]|uniref:STAS domain-containing protein n=1 Tax=Rubrivirga sp. IMCC45206 TaxID=3391614 RepID=UPI0039900CCD
MSHFSVSFDRLAETADGPVRVLELHGELDAHTAPDFEAALDTCLAGGDARLVADGSGLDYVSSAGLGVFMAYVEPARSGGGDLKIAALSEKVFEVFDLLGFPTVFDMHTTVAEAVEAF